MSDQDKPEEKPATPPPAWEKREFAINEKMKEVIRLGVKSTEAEISALRRKLRKLQYGA
jgi:hypothetical protein